MKKPLILLLWLACSVLFLAGCTSYDGKTISAGLSVELTRIERADDGTVAVSWSLMNPNVAPYLFSRVSSQIYLDGTLVGTTLDTAPLAVPAQQAANKVTRLTPAGPAADRLIAAAAARGQAAYRMDTQIIMLLYGDNTEKSTLTHAGTVPVTGK